MVEKIVDASNAAKKLRRGFRNDVASYDEVPSIKFLMSGDQSDKTLVQQADQRFQLIFVISGVDIGGEGVHTISYLGDTDEAL